jgi:hypothetical protein
LALTDADSNFSHSIKLSSEFILKFSPSNIYFISFILCILSLFTLGMIIYSFNILISNRLIGNIIIAIMILFDFLLETDIVYQKLIYISPFTWSNTSLLDLRRNVTIYPSLSYALYGYGILIFLCTSIIIISSKRYSLDKIGS